MNPAETTEYQDVFEARHIGIDDAARHHMLKTLGLSSLEQLIDEVVPSGIRLRTLPAVGEAASEALALAEIGALAANNTVKRSLIGQGYADCHLPAVIGRNVLENPAWYTAYTPYQPEIAQGRLEVLFNFQTLITELTALPIANASLLDEATAVAEAMAMAHRSARGKRRLCLVAADVHPQTLDVLRTRATPLQIDVQVHESQALGAALSEHGDAVFAIVLQYPGTLGVVPDVAPLATQARACGALSIVAADLLSLTVLPPPGELGVDIAVGSAQRFGVPMGFGGPHAAFMATTDKHKRSLPGRLVGQSLTSTGEPAYRLALQTREQHIRREKATSNICTAQALLAIIATLYACYHGPQGLCAIARRIRLRAGQLAATLAKHGCHIDRMPAFDTFSLYTDKATDMMAAAARAGFNVRRVDDQHLAISVDETTTLDDVAAVAGAL